MLFLNGLKNCADECQHFQKMDVQNIEQEILRKFYLIALSIFLLLMFNPRDGAAKLLIWFRKGRLTLTYN